jgi:hypothetical protein
MISSFTFASPATHNIRQFLGYYAFWLLLFWYFAALIMLIAKKIRMKSWVQVNANITEIDDAALRNTSIWRRPIASEIQLKYKYSQNGTNYENSRVTMFSFTKYNYNISLHRRLACAYKNGTPIQVWINPKKPYESIITKSVNWLDLSIVSIFVLCAYQVTAIALS